MNDLYEILTREASDVQALINVANSVIRATEKTNKPGRRHNQEYAGSKDEIAGAARQLAEMVLQALGQSNNASSGHGCTCDVLSVMGGVMLGYKKDCPVPSHAANVRR